MVETTTIETATAGNSGPGNPNPGAGNPNPPANGAAPSATDWITGIQNAELRGFVQQKGFKDPEILADSYRNLEKLMGAPKERIVKLPEKSDSPEWEQAWQRMGKPEKADGYGLEAGKDAKQADKDFIDWAKNAFHQSNLTSDQAKNLIAKFNEMQTKTATDQKAAVESAQKNEFDGLKTEWGNAYDQKLEVAKAGAKEFGLTTEQLDGIQKNLGYKKTMELFQSIGSKLGESGFVQGQSRNQPMDVNTARANLSAKKADKEFMGRYMNGGSVEKAELGKLFADAYPGEISI